MGAATMMQGIMYFYLHHEIYILFLILIFISRILVRAYKRPFFLPMEGQGHPPHILHPQAPGGPAAPDLPDPDDPEKRRRLQVLVRQSLERLLKRYCGHFFGVGGSAGEPVKGLVQTWKG